MDGRQPQALWLEWTQTAPFRFGFAVAIVLAAYGAQRALWPFIPPSPHLFFYPAVFLAARLGGTAPGCVATALATLGIMYEFLPPEGLHIESARDALDLVIFACVGIGISAALGQLRSAIQREHRAALEARAAKQSTDATWSMVAHDLRTPLNVIMLGSSELGRRVVMAPEVEKTLRLIQRSTDRARDLVEDALDAMRAAEGRLRVDPAPCDARELCVHVVDGVALLASGKGVTLTCDVSTSRQALCDPPRLAQVVTNLLSNAIKFTPAGGAVALRVDESEDRLRFSVRDTGVGIPADEIEAIFTKFWTGGATNGGLGLGLWIACAIVEAHGARLTVESRVGEGTIFAFSLPMVTGAAVAKTWAAAPVSARAS